MGDDGVLEIREDNAKAVAAAPNKAVAKALEEIGLAAEGYAKKTCPVDTGRLRNSITRITHQANARYMTNDFPLSPHAPLVAAEGGTWPIGRERRFCESAR